MIPKAVDSSVANANAKLSTLAGIIPIINNVMLADAQNTHIKAIKNPIMLTSFSCLRFPKLLVWNRIPYFDNTCYFLLF
ncbi:hypothetical protein LEQ_0065 [Ligilactobacillus equi DPC 6820]|uniref:Uncharacterized protein n=1 Tax=Ligilactobacillus equi DPC 6820 TaxID=1392007 RepID=V7HV43_9LACO|nr:hypothetical protein LEQ_0065 [Ligilactobacillus equi DPC 6820]